MAVVVCADGRVPIAKKLIKKPWTDLVGQASRGRTGLLALIYRRPLAEAVRACADVDRPVLQGLVSWVKDKVDYAMARIGPRGRTATA